MARPQFFRQLRQDRYPDPVLARCCRCDREANPAWGSKDGTFCQACAPDSLKNPSARKDPRDPRR